MALQVPDLDSLLNIELPEEYQENPKNLNYNASTSDLKWGKGFIQTNKSKKRKNNTFESNQRFFDYCDVCDKGFKTIMQKQNHFSQHVKVSTIQNLVEQSFQITIIYSAKKKVATLRLTKILLMNTGNIIMHLVSLYYINTRISKECFGY